MRKFLTLVILFIFFGHVVFSQKKVSISGKVTQNEIEVPGAVVELITGEIIKKVISGSKGEFKFAELTNKSSDSISFKVFYLGYKPVKSNINFPKSDTIIVLALKDLENISLDEVTVKGEKSGETNAYRSVYKINSKDFIKNTKGDKVLSTVPNISLQNDDILIDGRNRATIFINGIESNNQELKSLSSEDIDRIEVIENPSASYNSDFTGSVINVILKTKVANYIKGSLTATGGARNNYWSVFPTLAYKRGNFVMSSYYSRVDNSQKIDYNLNRQNADGTFYNQISVRRPDGYQEALNTKLSFGLSKKSKLNLSNDLSGYNFNANTSGFYNSDVFNRNIAFNNTNSVEKQNRWSVATVYSYTSSPKSAFYLKGKFFRYNNIDIFNIVDENNKVQNGDLKSTTDEITGEIDYALSDVRLFKLQTEIYSGLKYISREFDVVFDDFNLDQTSINIFSEVNTKISGSLSGMLGLSFENTKNNNLQLQQNYNFLLPTVNFLYKLPKNYSFRGGYSKKIIRPSANNLNDQLIFNNPGLARQGNENLEPQIRNYVFLTLTKKIKESQLSLKIFNEKISHAIIETYRMENQILVSTLENAARNESTGFSLGITTKLMDEVNLNLNYGIDYNRFQSNSIYSLIGINNGWTTRSNINLTSNVMKKKIALTLYGFYNGPLYTLINQIKVRPYIGFDAETSLLKNKLNISLSYNNIFAWNANRTEKSTSHNFNQIISTRNNTSNVLLSLSYFFGKKFSSSIANFYGRK